MTHVGLAMAQLESAPEPKRRTRMKIHALTTPGSVTGSVCHSALANADDVGCRVRGSP